MNKRIVQWLVGFTFVLAAVSANAEGTRGGGSGCMAAFMRGAEAVESWLKDYGQTLKPSVSVASFQAAVDDNAISFVDGDLRYGGNPVDAYYDGEKIKIRCDRFMANTPENQWMVVAHEVFRKMGLEGDRYEISRQISFSSPGPSLQSLSDGDIYAYYENPYACGYQVQINIPQNRLTVVAVNNPQTNAYCPQRGQSVQYFCGGNQCHPEDIVNTENSQITIDENSTFLKEHKTWRPTGVVQEPAATLFRTFAIDSCDRVLAKARSQAMTLCQSQKRASEVCRIDRSDEKKFVLGGQQCQLWTSARTQ